MCYSSWMRYIVVICRTILHKVTIRVDLPQNDRAYYAHVLQTSHTIQPINMRYTSLEEKATMEFLGNFNASDK